jgi:MYXO-CTERM domain-containing protein
MKTKLLASAGVGALLFAGVASADYQGLSAESTETAEGTVIRLYVNLDAGDRLDAVYGSGDHALTLGSTSALFNSSFGGNASTNINEALLAVFPTLANDSWVTIGAEHDGSVSGPANVLSLQGVDFGVDGNFASTSNGSWYITPDDAQGAEDGGRVLIAQLTIAGGGSSDDLYGNLNFQGKLADGSNWGATDQWLPAPGALALLGLAGFAGRRRRRA